MMEMKEDENNHKKLSTQTLFNVENHYFHSSLVFSLIL